MTGRDWEDGGARAIGVFLNGNETGSTTQHGEPDKKPKPDYFESYQRADKPGQDHSYGYFVAPSTGIHGWFFKNAGAKDVDFHLNVSGYFDTVTMFAGGPGEEIPVEDAK